MGTQPQNESDNQPSTPVDSHPEVPLAVLGEAEDVPPRPEESVADARPV